MDETRQEVSWAEGRRALIFERTTGQWVSAVGVGPDEELPDGERPGWASWFRETDEEPGRDRGRGWECLWHHETRTQLLPGQCRDCFEVDAHAPDCARGKRIAENLARGVWPWLVPFVMPDPPPKTDLEVDVFQVYPQGLDAMIDVSNPGHPADWRVNASDPDDDLPGQFALGWVALGPEGPTLAPWGL